MNIFDTEDISDLPKSLREHLGLATKAEMKVLKLFKLKDPLNNNEILVGYYRKYKKVIRKESLSVVLHNLGVKGFLMGTDKRGEYCLVEIKSKRFTNEK